MGVKISALPPAGTLADDDETPFVDDSVAATKKFTLAGLLVWLQSKTSWVLTAMINNGAVTPDKLGLGALTATIATGQTTTSAGVVNLATVGPSVTLNIGANGMALVLMQFSYSNSVINEGGLVFYSVSGASTMNDIPVINANRASRAATSIQVSGYALVTGLTPGSNTFLMRYGNNSGGTSTYSARQMIVIPL